MSEPWAKWQFSLKQLLIINCDFILQSDKNAFKWLLLLHQGNFWREDWKLKTITVATLISILNMLQCCHLSGEILAIVCIHKLFNQNTQPQWLGVVAVPLVYGWPGCPPWPPAVVWFCATCCKTIWASWSMPWDL